MFRVTRMIALFSLFFFGMAAAYGQMPQQPAPAEDVSDGELGKFAVVFTETQTLNQQIQQEMMTAVQEEGLEVQRFNEMMEAQQDPNKELDASEEEIAMFAAVSQALQKIQQEAQKDIQKVISDNGLTVQRYQSIMMALRNDTDLQQRLREQMEE